MGAHVLPGDRDELAVEVVNHLHPVNGLLEVHEVVLISPFDLSLFSLFALSLF